MESLGILWVPGHSLFHRTTRFASFPDYLVIQIKKFTFGLDWVPKKLGMVAGTREAGEAGNTRNIRSLTGSQMSERKLVFSFPPKGENITLDVSKRV